MPAAIIIGRSRPIPALDGIRGVAIMWVVFHNATAFSYASRLLFHVPAILAQMGWIGVELFFALSGFLITRGLLETQATAHYFRNFYAKRALRILPLYYTVLFVLLVVLPRLITLHPPYSNEHQASLWFFFANWTPLVPYGFAHFWSLAVEEQFYLFWPLVVCWLPAGRLLRVCLWAAVGTLFLRGAMAAYGADWWTLYATTPARMDALALGGAVACVMHLPALRAWMRMRLAAMSVATLLLFLLGAVLTHAYDRTTWPGQTLGYTLLAVCSAALVGSVAVTEHTAPTRLASVLAWRPLRSFGRYSYAIYVFHNLLHKLVGEPWLTKHFGESPPVQVVFMYASLVLAVSYLLGMCSYHVLEKHFLTLKRYFEPGGRPPRSVRVSTA
jgi:peptidoglycan/LPS O-acetylase OafA/YrhL